MPIVTNDRDILINNLHKLHTTELGKQRILKNLRITVANPVEWCKTQILDGNSFVESRGKNFYVSTQDFIITINRTSFTIITAKIRASVK